MSDRQKKIITTQIIYFEFMRPRQAKGLNQNNPTADQKWIGSLIAEGPDN